MSAALAIGIPEPRLHPSLQLALFALDEIAIPIRKCAICTAMLAPVCTHPLDETRKDGESSARFHARTRGLWIGGWDGKPWVPREPVFFVTDYLAEVDPSLLRYTHACKNPACRKSFKTDKRTVGACSPECRDVLYRAAAAQRKKGVRVRFEPRVCACGREYVPKRHHAVTCGRQECQEANAKAKLADWGKRRRAAAAAKKAAKKSAQVT